MLRQLLLWTCGFCFLTLSAGAVPAFADQPKPEQVALIHHYHHHHHHRRVHHRP
jgi:hypothetical protein